MTMLIYVLFAKFCCSAYGRVNWRVLSGTSLEVLLPSFVALDLPRCDDHGPCARIEAAPLGLDILYVVTSLAAGFGRARL
jgi:hypothetical protein